MEKCKKIKAEFHLPEAIIQHIQSFMDRKVAAKTIILSKSWYSAWLTRPNLDFDEWNFEAKANILEGESRFWELVRKTLQRYDDLQLRIDSLRLRIRGITLNMEHYCYSRSRELITKALKMGATDINFEISDWKRYQYITREFVLPHEVLGNENLIKLSVGGCKFDGKLSCSRLKSLSLLNVHLERDIIEDIISSCPLIEKLTLSQYPFVLMNSINSNICKLKCLLLDRLNVHTSFFHDLSSKFPCLKDLGVHNCYGYKKIEISSPSLESISFTQPEKKMLRVKFDVPSIRKFTFSGSRPPSLSFTASRSNWESHISISCKRHPNATWFPGLNKLLRTLSPSKVKLSLYIWPGASFNRVGNVQGLPTPPVDNLWISFPPSECHALFNILFQICRPVFVTHDGSHELRKSIKRNSDAREIVYKILMQKVCVNCCIANQSKSDLEDVIMEYFYEDVSAWRPLPVKSLLDALTSPAVLDASTSAVGECSLKSLLDALSKPFADRRIRFHLRWKREPTTFE